MDWLKKLFGRTKKTAVQIGIEARAALVIAAERLAEVLEDADNNGVPDVAEKAARYAAQMVSLLELIHGAADGSGAIKLNSAMQEVVASSRRGLAVWKLAVPFIEAAVSLLPRKRLA